MEWTGLNELREKYLSFFESKSHTRLKSFSLIPNNDKSLLLINSGMAPMKKYFLGEETPPNKRVTTCQKCIRTPDIERVGKTARHGTYFEMLGNFSFGDYFKEDAIAWAWEFLTGTLAIPAEKLWITVFESDDEAENIWADKIGVPRDRIVRLGKEDNFWEHGSGPCGPCSEIHFDRGEKYGPFESFEQASDCDRIIEIWNLVFSQFNSDGKGNYEEMQNKNIDTGMGLERLACVMQDVGNLFEVDTVQNIMKHVCKIAGTEYKSDEKTDVSLRVITDHIRSTTFMIGDGVIPSNEGRGYVLRRLLRRAARHGRLIGITEPFLYKVCDTVINENKSAYPELDEKSEYIKKWIKVEEENFAKTIDQGMELLNSVIEKTIADGNKTISGADAFKLNDTYGFPIDLTKEIAEEKGLAVDEAEFAALLDDQKKKARADRASKAKTSWLTDALGDFGCGKTKFTGYTDFEAAAKIVAIAKDNEITATADEGDEVIIVLDKTPFYAESGGQVADNGVIVKDGGELTVTDCQKNAHGQFMHTAVVKSGSFEVGDAVTAKINPYIRRAIMRNHTSAHLLQAALRQVLGDHVHQAGSYVDAERMRFDFSHFSAMSPEEIRAVEAIVNDKILEALPVTMDEMPIEEAKKRGAMALFGEKYGDVVRVVEAKGFSTEFCGGTHVDNTSRLGLFKIISESSVASGTRRIEGTTGYGVLSIIDETNELIEKTAQSLKVNNASELPQKAAAVTAELREKDKTIESLNAKIAEGRIDGLFENAKDIEGISFISAMLSGTSNDTLRAMCDKIKDKAPRVVAVIAGASDNKGTIMVACGAEAVKMGMHAGKLVKMIAAEAGGNGGGRPDSAMAGVKEIFKIDEAVAKTPEFIKTLLK